MQAVAAKAASVWLPEEGQQGGRHRRQALSTTKTHHKHATIAGSHNRRLHVD